MCFFKLCHTLHIFLNSKFKGNNILLPPKKRYTKNKDKLNLALCSRWLFYLFEWEMPLYLSQRFFNPHKISNALLFPLWIWIVFKMYEIWRILYERFSFFTLVLKSTNSSGRYVRSNIAWLGLFKVTPQYKYPVLHYETPI